MSEGDAERHTFLKAGHRSVDPGILISHDELKRILAVPPCWLSKLEVSKPRDSIIKRLLRLIGVKRD